MAKKSKTQKAKAKAARAAKKQAKLEAEKKAAQAPKIDKKEEESKKSGIKIFKQKKNQKPQQKEKTAAELRQERRDRKMAEKENRAPKKHNKIVQFFIDVKAEMKRVTWPTRKDVIQWTGVVIAALAFFIVYVFILDYLIIQPLLALVAGIGS